MLPRIPVKKLTSRRPISTMRGPGDSTSPDFNFGILAGASVISTYPLVPGRPYREGDPICDRFILKLYENRGGVCIGRWL